MRLLAVTGGHRVDLDAFSAMLDAVCLTLGASWEHAVHPDALARLGGHTIERFDAVLLHDIAGLRLQRGSMPIIDGPDEPTRQALSDLLDSGIGIIATHHALASWPGWDRWAHAVGGRYLYAPGTLDGQSWPSSGYRMGRHRAVVVDRHHPLCAGIEDFDLDDELYLCPIFDDEFTPLLATSDELDGARFTSTVEEVLGEPGRDCRHHPPGSPTIAWAKTAGECRLVYLQPGHGPETMGDPMYRRLLSNAVSWVASTDDVR